MNVAAERHQMRPLEPNASISCLPCVTIPADGTMDINDPESTAFQYLAYLHDLGSGRNGGGPINRLGWDLGLSNNEIKDVAQYLRSLGMLELRSGSRGWRMSDILSLSAVISERGRKHVSMIRASAENSDVD